MKILIQARWFVQSNTSLSFSNFHDIRVKDYAFYTRMKKHDLEIQIFFDLNNKRDRPYEVRSEWTGPLLSYREVDTKIQITERGNKHVKQKDSR